MSGKRYLIRQTRPEEYFETETLCREAFWNVYRPGALEHYVLHTMRSRKDFVGELDLVMEMDGRIVGQNVFVRSVIHGDDHKDYPIMSMGPICVAPFLQKQGYGKILLDCSLERAARLGCPAVCFEGNIGFYGKSGFSYAREFGLRYHGLPEGADDSFFLCKELRNGYFSGVTGEYAVPELYLVDEKAAEEYDKNFPPREKKKLPGQLFPK